MRMFAFTSVDGSADGNGAFGTDDNSANQMAGSPGEATNALSDTINSGGIDWQTMGIAPYQSAAAAVGPFTLSASDPVAASGWLTQATQPPQSGIDGWLTQTMQPGGASSQTSGASVTGTSVVSGAGFDANGDQIIWGIGPATSAASPNPLQTHAA